MPPKRLTRDESQARTRAQLLRAANRLFVRDGYAATSLAAIAAEAAVTKGAVYSNFASKDELFLAVLEDAREQTTWFAPREPSGDGPDGPATSPAARGAALGEAVAAIGPSRQQVALFHELNATALRAGRARAEVAAHSRRYFASYGRALAGALGIEVDDPATLGLVAQSLYVGLTMHRAFDGEIGADAFARAYELLASFGPPVDPPAH